MNARSINANYPRLQIELNINPFDVMSFTESWFKSTQISLSYGFPGFVVHRVDREWVDDELEYDEDGNPKTGGGFVPTYVNVFTMMPLI